MSKRISHIGIAVKSIEESSKIFSALLNAEREGTETVPDQKVRLAIYHVGDASLELTEPTSPDSPIAKFIEKRGEGVHHLSIEVDDIKAELTRLRAAGFQLIDERPRKGAGGTSIAFIHPKSTNGILVELCQKT